MKHSLASTILRRSGMVWRIIELTVVLLLVVVGTVLNLVFGWVAFLSRPSLKTTHTKSVAFPATITTSKEF